MIKQRHPLFEHLIVPLVFLQRQRVRLHMKIIFLKLINKFKHRKIHFNHFIFLVNIQSTEQTLID